MKKLFILSFIILMIFVGCSASTDMEVQSIYDNTTYSYETLSFINKNQEDILYYIYDDFQDFPVMVDVAVTNEIITEVPSDLDNILDTLATLSESSGESFRSLIERTSAEFNTLAINNSLSLTVDDIVGFNNLKTFLVSLIGRTTISKITYLELLLDRELSDEEKLGLNLLQNEYSNIRKYDYYFSLTDLDYADFELVLMENNPEISEANLDLIEIGYLVFLELTE